MLLVGALADGEWHCAEALAKVTGSAPGEVVEEASRLARLGLDIESSPDHGVRLSRSLDLLGEQPIRAALRDDVSPALSSLDVFAELDSTNAHLLRGPPPEPGCLSVAVAEFQHAGRGRRGRSWNMPFGSGIGLSVGWTLAGAPGSLPALSLAAGVITRQVIDAVCGCAPSLKWPNDLVWNDRKLGGILVESALGDGGICHIVLGIGINVSMDGARLKKVGERPGSAIDLERMTAGQVPSRNELAARLIEGYLEMFRTYEVAGFGAYRAAFVEADCLRDREVVVTGGPGPVSGTARSVDDSGALLLETDSGTRLVVTGEVGARPVR